MTIFTLNTWLLPFSISIDNQIRFKRIIEMIEELDPDIITLQEVWLNKYVRKLRAKFSSKYNIFNSDISNFYNASGLITLVKKDIEIKNYNIYHFKTANNSNFEERIAKKGFQKFELNINNKILTLVNLHLYADTLNKSRQQTQLKHILGELTESNFIISGDFNLTWEDISNITNILRYPLLNLDTISKANPYQQVRANKKSKNEFKIDHVLINTESKFRINNEILVKENLSDHYAILASIE